ncbi:MAG: hypothetical protein AAFY65_11435 [Pseudomonadota bacterium]
MTETSDLGRQARDAAADLGQQVKSAAEDHAHHHAEAARDHAADHVQSTADAANAAAGALHPGSIQAEAVQHVADRIEGLAQNLRTTDIRTSLNSVNTFARENPVLFVAGAALLGVAATRFLKARDPEGRPAPVGADDPWAAPQNRAMGAAQPRSEEQDDAGL